MSRRSLRRSLAAVCTAVFAAGLLGVSASAPAGAETRGQVATPPPPGAGVQIVVGNITVGGAAVEQEPQPAGWVSFT